MCAARFAEIAEGTACVVRMVRQNAAGDADSVEEKLQHGGLRKGISLRSSFAMRGSFADDLNAGAISQIRRFDRELPFEVPVADSVTRARPGCVFARRVSFAPFRASPRLR